MADEKERLLRDILYEIKLIKTNLEKFKTDETVITNSIKSEVRELSRKLDRR